MSTMRLLHKGTHQLLSCKSRIVLTGWELGLGSLKVLLRGIGRVCVCPAHTPEPRLGCWEYLEGGGHREAHKAGAEMGLAQYGTHGGREHQAVPQELQVGREPPARGGRLTAASVRVPLVRPAPLGTGTGQGPSSSAHGVLVMVLPTPGPTQAQ